MAFPFEISATTDIVFQYLFSSAGSEAGLLGFINAVQMSVNRPPAKEVTIRNPFNLQEFLEDKQSIVDLKAVDSEGRTYDVEMQTVDKKGFERRILYYWSRLYVEQLQTGADYTRLNPVISIILTQFDLLPKLSDLHNVFSIRAEKDPNVILTDDFQLHTLELTPKKWERLIAEQVPEPYRMVLAQIQLRNWVDFFLNGNRKTEAEMEKMIEETPGLDVTYGKFQAFTRDESLRDLAFRRQMAQWDHDAEIQLASEKGEEKGLVKGRAEGRAEGRVEGRVEGRAEGRVETLSETLRKLLDFRFGGAVPTEIMGLIETSSDAELLEDLFALALAAKTLEEFLGKISF